MRARRWLSRRIAISRPSVNRSRARWFSPRTARHTAGDHTAHIRSTGLPERRATSSPCSPRAHIASRSPRTYAATLWACSTITVSKDHPPPHASSYAVSRCPAAVSGSPFSAVYQPAISSARARVRPSLALRRLQRPPRSFLIEPPLRAEDQQRRGEAGGHVAVVRETPVERDADVAQLLVEPAQPGHVGSAGDRLLRRLRRAPQGTPGGAARLVRILASALQLFSGVLADRFEESIASVVARRFGRSPASARPAPRPAPGWGRRSARHLPRTARAPSSEKPPTNTESRAKASCWAAVSSRQLQSRHARRL